MLPEDCKNCKKPKAIFFTQIIDGKIKKFDLCADCPYASAVNDPSGFGLAEQLNVAGVEAKETEVQPTKACQVCGFTLADFRKTGRLGCSECYEEFFAPIETLIRPMQRGMTHTGKIPVRLKARLELQRSLTEMESALKTAVENENYELAAKLRDELKVAEKKLEAVKNS